MPGQALGRTVHHDLRPEFHDAYQQDFLVTPNLDKFAKSALTWRRAYVQFSHCRYL